MVEENYIGREDVELRVFKSRVLGAAKSCPQGRAILEILFPEVFKVETYPCGTIFVDEQYANDVFLRNGRQSEHIELSIENLEHFWLLTHLNEERTYGLVNMKTGFRRRKSGFTRRVYLRKNNNPGIEIPGRDLDGLTVYKIDRGTITMPDIADSTKKMTDR